MALSLNEEQAPTAYSDPSGIALVEAVAGCGKSRVLRERVSHLIHCDKEADRKSKVCVLAFNKSVQEELTEKLSQDLSDTDFKRVTVRTFHALAVAMVNRFRTMTPLKRDPELVTKAWMLEKYAKEWLSKQPLYRDKLKDSEIKLLLGLDSKRIRMGIPLQDALSKTRNASKTLEAMTPDEVETWVETLRHFRYQTGYVTFDDMLELAAKLPPEAYKAMGYTHLLADELQDLNCQQRAIVRGFVPHVRSFMGVGDMAQSIYSFAGADAKIFEKMRKDFPQARTFTLSTNYRSSPQILHLANQVLEHDVRTALRMKPHDGAPSGPAPMILSGFEGLKSWLDGLRAAGYPWKDIVVLYRARKHTPQLELSLSEAGIPYRLQDGSYFDQAVIQDMLSYFYMLYATPEKAHFLRTFEHTKWLGEKSASEIWDMTDGNPTGWDRDDYPRSLWPKNHKLLDQYWDFLDDLETLRDDPVAVARRLFDRLMFHWENKYGDDPDRLNEQVQTAESFVDWVQAFGTDGNTILRSIEARERGQDLDNADEDVLDILTVHKSKGLERRAVALWAVGDKTMPLPAGEPDEEMRLLYVGVTRAIEDLAIILEDESQRYSTLPRHIPDVRNVVSAIFERPGMLDLLTG